MTQIRFIGVDPSMSNLGIAMGYYSSAERFHHIEVIQLVHTEPSNAKQVRKSSQDFERCRHLFTELHQVIAYYRPRIAFAEMPLGSQSANGMKSYGISLMLLGTIPVPVVQVMPEEVKLATCGKRTATKRQMIDWATERWPKLNWPRYNKKGKALIAEGQAEHLADACGVVEAGVRTPEWRQAVAIAAADERHELRRTR